MRRTSTLPRSCELLRGSPVETFRALVDGLDGENILVAVACAMVLVSCAEGGLQIEAGPVRKALIYGEDDRVEAPHREWTSATVAMVRRDALPYLSDAGAGVSFEAVHGLCPGERFAAQPAVAECTGVLISDDLVLTAGHCLERVSSCQDYVYVRNYTIDGDTGLLSRGWTALECEEPRVVVNTSILDEQNLDFAVLRLTERVRDLVPPTLRRRPVRAGEAVTTLGTSGGLPVKATTGLVLSVRPEGDYFDFTGDLFGGGSGSGVFDADGALVGIHVRGSADFELTPAGCRRSRTVAENGSESEQANTLSSVLDALCGLEPEPSLCSQDSELPDAGAPTAPSHDATPGDVEEEPPPAAFVGARNSTRQRTFPSALLLRGSDDVAPEGPEVVVGAAEVLGPVQEDGSCSFTAVQGAGKGARYPSLLTALGAAATVVLRRGRKPSSD